LDWEDLTLSPVWDSETGFGGNGNSSDEKSVAYGSCVTDGPFARLIALIWGVEDQPHCLSRGFAKHEKVKKFGLRVQPEALKKVLKEPNYDSFNLGLEYGPHNAIPLTVRGDFYKVTAPYGMFPYPFMITIRSPRFQLRKADLNYPPDPIFYLHHTMLDRMWWLWQQMDPSDRLLDYGGKAAANSTERAALTDLLHVSSLAPPVTVSEIMSTESTLLCYRY
jgi:tyrosinase